MTRIVPLLLATLLAAPARGATTEALRAGAGRTFAAALSLPILAPDPAPEPVLQDPPRLSPLTVGATPGAVLARVNLAAQLDRHHDLMTRQLGARPWSIGVAADVDVHTYYLVFSHPGLAAPVLAPLGQLNRLIGSGVDARLDARTAYNFRVSLNFMDPVRGSVLRITPAQGTSGPGHDVTTGQLLDAARARATVLRTGGAEFWLFYGNAARADGSGLGPARGLLFVRLNGLSTKAWPVAESALALDRPTQADLGGIGVVLTRSSSGELLVAEAR